jgi:hypothetical protein
MSQRWAVHDVIASTNVGPVPTLRRKGYGKREMLKDWHQTLVPLEATRRSAQPLPESGVGGEIAGMTAARPMECRYTWRNLDNLGAEPAGGQDEASVPGQRGRTTAERGKRRDPEASRVMNTGTESAQPSPDSWPRRPNVGPSPIHG